MAHFIGIDIGTSGTKTLLVNAQGEVVAAASAEYPAYAPKPLWSEQDPADWWRATCQTVQAVLAKGKVQAADVKGVGLSGQMHGGVFLDAEGQVLRRAILWNDCRTAAECAELTQKVGAKRLIEIAGNPAYAGFTAPKILWVRKNEPAVYEKTRKVVLPKDYIRYRLTAEYATEVSDASGMLLLDVPKRKWSKEILEKLELDESLLGRCYESPEVSGRVTAEAAKATGLKAGTPVVGGGGDQAAGAVGNGIVRQGVISATMGTSGVVFAHSEQVQIDPAGRVHAFCHAVPGKWHVMGVILAAGGSYQWFRNVLCAAEREVAAVSGQDPYVYLNDEAAAAPAGCEGLFWLPYLTGERTPHGDPFARACFVGLTPRHNKGALARAVLEGATYAMRDALEIIKGMKIPVAEIRLSGGGAKSPIWRQIQADVYGQEVVTINASEGPAYGVALLAGVGTGNWKTVAEACDAAIAVTGRTAVIPENKKVYDKFYPLYQGLYRSLKDDFRKIAEAVG